MVVAACGCHCRGPLFIATVSVWFITGVAMTGRPETARSASARISCALW